MSARITDLAAWKVERDGQWKTLPKLKPPSVPTLAEDLRARLDAKLYAPEVLEPFNRFWNIYPRKVAKRAALLEWWRMKPDAALVDEIIAGTERYRERVKTWDKKYIKYPAGWLIAERWTDED